MAVDKLVDSTQLDADLTSVANAIRTKGGTSAQLAFPSGFVSAVEAIPTGGGGSSDEWVRPSDWPNLDSIDFTNFEGVYLTYDLRVCEEPFRVVSLFFTVSNAGSYIVERGTLSNGVFTAIESETVASNSAYYSELDPENGDVQLFRVTPSGGNITSGGFYGYKVSSTDNVIAQVGAQPCVEQYTKTPSINLNGSYNSAAQASQSYPSHVTMYMQHDKLIGTYTATTIANNFWGRAYLLKVIELECSFPNLTSFGWVQWCTTLQKFDTSKSTFDKEVSLQLLLYYSHIQDIDLSGITEGVNSLNRIFEYAHGTKANIIWPEINITNANISFNNQDLVFTSASASSFASALPTIESAYTVNLGTNKRSFSAADIALITQKGWTIT